YLSAFCSHTLLLSVSPGSISSFVLPTALQACRKWACSLIVPMQLSICFVILSLPHQRTSAPCAAAAPGLRDSVAEPKVLPGPCCAGLLPPPPAPEGNGARGLASLGGAEPRTRPGPTKLLLLDSLLQRPPMARCRGRRIW